MITHELACAIWGLCWYNSLDVSRDHIRPVFAHRTSTTRECRERPWKLIQKIPGKPAPSQKKNVETKRLPPLTATLLPRTSRRKNTRRRQKLTKKTTHAKTPNAPPSSLFLKGCLLSLPHCFQEHHEEKTQEEDNNDRKKTTYAKTPKASGGEALRPPPNPPPAFFFKGCLLSLPQCFQEHHEEKTQEEEDKNDRKKQHAKTPHASGGRRCALPPNPPPAFFFKGCLLSLPHCFQEHHEEKTQEEDKT